MFKSSVPVGMKKAIIACGILVFYVFLSRKVSQSMTEKIRLLKVETKLSMNIIYRTNSIFLQYIFTLSINCGCMQIRGSISWFRERHINLSFLRGGYFQSFFFSSVSLKFQCITIACKLGFNIVFDRLVE